MSFLGLGKSDEEKLGVDAIELLKDQHREVERLFSEIEAAGDRAYQAREELFLQLAQKIEAHAKIEEKIFYPAGKPVDASLTLEAYEEHDLVHTLIKKLSTLEPSDETFMPKITVLKELIEHHVKEEEHTYFPEVRSALGDERIMALGKQLQADFDRQMQVKLVRGMPKKAAASHRKVAKTTVKSGAKAKTTGKALTSSKSLKSAKSSAPKKTAAKSTRSKKS